MQWSFSVRNNHWDDCGSSSRMGQDSDRRLIAFVRERAYVRTQQLEPGHGLLDWFLTNSARLEGASGPACVRSWRVEVWRIWKDANNYADGRLKPHSSTAYRDARFHFPIL